MCYTRSLPVELTLTRTNSIVLPCMGNVLLLHCDQYLSVFITEFCNIFPISLYIASLLTTENGTVIWTLSRRRHQSHEKTSISMKWHALCLGCASGSIRYMAKFIIEKSAGRCGNDMIPNLTTATCKHRFSCTF